MDTKVTTVIVNDTKQGLTMNVGNRNCYVRLTNIKEGGEYKLRLDVNWTYQEFLVQAEAHRANEVFLNSDDCCDCERITITEVNGTLDVRRVLRQKFRTATPSAVDLGSSNPSSSWKLWLRKFIRV